MGLGFAVTYYYGQTDTTSELPYEEYSVYLTSSADANANPISSAITFDGPTCSVTTVDENHKAITVQSTEVSATGYYIKVNYPGNTGPMNVSAKIIMNDPRSWSIIDNVKLTIVSNGTYEIAWTPEWTSGAWTSASIDLGDAVSTVDPTQHLGGLLKTNSYSLTITVTYKEMTNELAYVTESDSFLDLTGTQFLLMGSVNDPVPESS